MDQQPTLEHIQALILDSSQETISELQHTLVTILDSLQGFILGSLQELQHILATILDSLQVTTLGSTQVLETTQEIMPVTLAEHTRKTSLVQQ